MKNRNEDGCMVEIQKDRASHISGVINPKKGSLTIFIKLTNAHILQSSNSTSRDLSFRHMLLYAK